MIHFFYFKKIGRKPMEISLATVAAAVLLVIAASIVAVFLLFNAYNRKYVVEIVGNQILLNRKPIVAGGGLKRLPALSPDRKRLAFACLPDFGKEPGFGKIGIIELKTGRLNYINNEAGTCSFMNLEWIDNSTIAVTAHVNPSLDVYALYNADEFCMSREFYGTGFLLDPSKAHVYYIKPAPHFSRQSAHDAVMVDNTAIYQAESGMQIMHGFYVSDDFRGIAFFEENLENNTANLVVVRMVGLDQQESVSKVKWEYPVQEIQWIDEAVLSIGGILYDVADGVLKKK